MPLGVADRIRGRTRRCSTDTTGGANAVRRRRCDGGLRLAAGGGDDRQYGGARPSRGEWAKGESAAKAIGRSRGGRTTKIDALIDLAGQPLAFHLIGGHIADITVAAPLLDQAAPSAWLIGDRGDDADHLHALSKAAAPFAVIPNKANRKGCRVLQMTQPSANPLARRKNQHISRSVDFREFCMRY